MKSGREVAREIAEGKKTKRYRDNDRDIMKHRIYTGRFYPVHSLPSTRHRPLCSSRPFCSHSLGIRYHVSPSPAPIVSVRTHGPSGLEVASCDVDKWVSHYRVYTHASTRHCDPPSLPPSSTLARQRMIFKMTMVQRTAHVLYVFYKTQVCENDKRINYCLLPMSREFLVLGVIFTRTSCF